MESYIKNIIDIDTMDVISKNPDKELAGYMIQLVVYHTIDLNKHPGDEFIFNKTYDLSWFNDRLKPLCNHLFAYNFSYKRFVDEVYNRYLDVLSFKTAFHKTKPIVFEKLLLNHSRINQSLYWILILDISVSELSELSVCERKALYDKLFPKSIDEPDLEVTRLISFTNPHSRELLSNEFMNSEGFYTSSALELYDYINYENELSEDARALLNSQIKKIQGSAEQGFFEEYLITDIYQILFLELEQMIKKRHLHKEMPLLS